MTQDCHICERELLETYAEELLMLLRECHPKFLSEIDRLVLPHRNIVLTNSQFKRGIFLFSRFGDRDLVSEWAYYVLTAAQAIHNGRLREFRQFEKNRIARAYIFQLSIIFNHLSRCWAYPLQGSVQVIAPMTSPVGNGNSDLSQKLIPPSRSERDALTEIVLPQMHAISDWLTPNQGDEVVEISIQDFHSEEILQGIFHRGRSAMLVDSIVSAYELYPTVIRSIPEA